MFILTCAGYRQKMALTDYCIRDSFLWKLKIISNLWSLGLSSFFCFLHPVTDLRNFPCYLGKGIYHIWAVWWRLLSQTGNERYKLYLCGYITYVLGVRTFWRFKLDQKKILVREPGWNVCHLFLDYVELLTWIVAIFLNYLLWLL